MRDQSCLRSVSHGQGSLPLPLVVVGLAHSPPYRHYQSRHLNDRVTLSTLSGYHFLFVCPIYLLFMDRKPTPYSFLVRGIGTLSASLSLCLCFNICRARQSFWSLLCLYFGIWITVELPRQSVRICVFILLLQYQSGWSVDLTSDSEFYQSITFSSSSYGLDSSGKEEKTEWKRRGESSLRTLSWESDS